MKRFIAAVLVLLLLTSLTSTLASTPGSAADPLISLSYISNTFYPETIDDCNTEVTEALGTLYDSAEAQVQSTYDAYMLLLSGYSGYTLAGDFTPLELTAGKNAQLVTGSTFILTAGQASLYISSGTVINISTGAEVSSNEYLSVNQRYFCAEDTTAVVTALTDSSCQVDGYYTTSGSIVVDTNSFLDVSSSDWFYDAVVYARENGLFSGTSELTFSPQSSMTRGMFVTVLYRLAGKPSVSSASAFPDVAAESLYYYDAVVWSNANGIVTGYDDGRFYPDNLITREQMAVIMYRYASYAGYSTASNSTSYDTFPDTGNVSSFASEAMQWSTYNGLINGSDGKLLPKDTASRAQVAQIILNFCRNIVGM